MEFPVFITRAEVDECAVINEKVHAYRTLKEIISAQNEMADCLGLVASTVERINVEECEAKKAVHEWWIRMTEKYGLPRTQMMNVDFETYKITLLE